MPVCINAHVLADHFNRRGIAKDKITIKVESAARIMPALPRLTGIRQAVNTPQGILEVAEKVEVYLLDHRRPQRDKRVVHLIREGRIGGSNATQQRQSVEGRI